MSDASGKLMASSLSTRHDEPSSGSSACSTVSTRGARYLYNKIPQKPDENDPVKWAQFLSAYQRGDWQSTQGCPNQCTKKARKVQLANGEWIDSRGGYCCCLLTQRRKMEKLIT